MAIHPVQNAQDHRAALKRIEELWGAEAGTEDGNELDVLLALVEHYEDKYFPIPDMEPVELIVAHMEATGHTKAELGAILGGAPRVSDILHKRRALTVDMIHKLSTTWGLPASCLVRPYHLERTGA